MIAPRRALVLAFAMVALPPGARADTTSTKPILVLESHVGPRPAELGRVMRTLDDLLEKHGFAARPATILRLAERDVPRPGILDADLTAAQIAQHLNDGWSKFVAAQWDEAIDTLTIALAEAHRNPSLVVNDTSNLDLTFKAYVALAVSQQRTADAGSAARTMIETIRMFPSRPVARSEAWGREGERLYRDLYRQVGAMGRGRLSIAAGSPDAAIFVDGQLRGMGAATLADLVPGAYRVFIRMPGAIGRQYETNVSPNDDTYLNVEAELDASLRVTDAWIGFQFTSEAARGKERKYAGELARRWTGRDAVVVLVTGWDKGRPIVEGVRYHEGIEVRRARIYADASETGGSSQQLVQFLTDGRSAAGIEILRTDATPAPAVVRRHWGRASKITLGTGAVVLAASSALYFASPGDDHLRPTYDDRKTPALGVFTGGSVVVGLGTYLYLREARSAGMIPAALVGAGAAAMLSGAMLYVADQDPYLGHGWQRPTYRETSTAGLIIGGAGIALAGAGIWLLGREHEQPVRSPALQPIVSVQRGSGFIGWARRF